MDRATHVVLCPPPTSGRVGAENLIAGDEQGKTGFVERAVSQGARKRRHVPRETAADALEALEQVVGGPGPSLGIEIAVLIEVGDDKLGLRLRTSPCPARPVGTAPVKAMVPLR
jgi:hypothetical protein